MSTVKLMNCQWTDTSTNFHDMIARFEFLEEINSVDTEINNNIHNLLEKILQIQNNIETINEIMDYKNSELGTVNTLKVTHKSKNNIDINKNYSKKIIIKKKNNNISKNLTLR